MLQYLFAWFLLFVWLKLYVHGKQMVMSERSIIFALLTEHPNGKLPVLSVYSFAVLLESAEEEE